jgi:phenylacetate-CoA ligase
MSSVNLRKSSYFFLVGLRGQPLGAHYERFLHKDREGIPPGTSQRLLVKLLAHCKASVPYYARVMEDMGDSFHEDPEGYLQHLPLLSRDTLRHCFDELKSKDLARRKWYLNTTGGSTGEPVEFIQDWEYSARSGAITLLFAKLVGREIGESEVQIWGSVRDIAGSTESLRARFVNKLTNTRFLSVFELSPDKMREYISILNTWRPKLIVAYAGAMYELAKFAEGEGLDVARQSAIITTAVTLYPFMRQTIERVFQCKVFNRYGSREVGDVAIERPGFGGLWVAPWGNYVEIVDEQGNRVPDGTEGEIVVTSLTNFAMPLLRYRIGDRGMLSGASDPGTRSHGQVLERIVGRTYDMFVNRHGTLVEGGHFMALLYFRDWISRYQVIQEEHSRIVYRVVTRDSETPEQLQAELDEIAAKTSLIMHDDCDVAFEFVDQISPSVSGKYRFIVSRLRS